MANEGQWMVSEFADHSLHRVHYGWCTQYEDTCWILAGLKANVLYCKVDFGTLADLMKKAVANTLLSWSLVYLTF